MSENSEVEMQPAEQTADIALLKPAEGPEEGLGDDEELAIGGKVAGMR